MRIYRISAKGTAFECPKILENHGINEILCLGVVGGLYYCPDLKVVFHRNEKFGNYSWDYATFPDYDKEWDKLCRFPSWRTDICNVDTENEI